MCSVYSKAVSKSESPNCKFLQSYEKQDQQESPAFNDCKTFLYNKVKKVYLDKVYIID
jgi:hypothetical protein